MARLVNKQFNTPIGLYSEQNIKEVIQRESQILANGAVGINFNNSTGGKPSNLQNSAVLRMLEEEEHRQRSGQSPSNGYDSERPLRDQIKWPPPDFEDKNRQRSSFKDVVIPGVKRVAWPPPNEEGYIEQPPAEVQGGPQYSSQSPNLQNNQAPAPQQQASQAQSNRYPLKPLNISNGTTNYQQSPLSPLANQSPLGFSPSSANKQWAPVHSPVITPGQPQFKVPSQQYQSPQPFQPAPQQYQPTSQQYQPPQQQYQQYQTPPQQYQSPSQQYQHPPQQYQSTQQYQLPQSQPQSSAQSVAASNQVISQQYQPPVRKVEPPPATITLRQQAPVSQAPPPVVTSQPATATLKGGKHLRGDLKWPPENVRAQMEEEYRQRLELERGPAFRPTLNKKDYGPFFAQHALNASYPGYKIPPGTQFYEHLPRV